MRSHHLPPAKRHIKAFRWWADNGPLIVVFETSLPLSIKKELCQSIPSDRTFWIRACPDMKKLLVGRYNQATTKKMSNQEIPQSQTADNHMVPRGSAAQPLRDTREKN